VSVSAGSYLNYVDALEPTDPETIAPHPDVEYTTTAEVDAHELKRAVATVFGSGDGAVYVTLTDGALWATVPDVEAVGTASLSGTDGPQTYTRLSDELFEQCSGGSTRRDTPSEHARRVPVPRRGRALCGHDRSAAVPRRRVRPDERGGGRVVSIDAGAGNPREMYALRDALMENGIVLVDLRRSQGDPHVVYEQPADAETDADSAHLQQVVTIALVFATHAGTVDRLATATAIDPETGTVAGRLYVNRRVIDEYRRDAISKQAYAREVASTYRGRSIDA